MQATKALCLKLWTSSAVEKSTSDLSISLDHSFHIFASMRESLEHCHTNLGTLSCIVNHTSEHQDHATSRYLLLSSCLCCINPYGQWLRNLSASISID